MTWQKFKHLGCSPRKSRGSNFVQLVFIEPAKVSHEFKGKVDIVLFFSKPDNDGFGRPVNPSHLIDLTRPFNRIFLIDGYEIDPDVSRCKILISCSSAQEVV
jgi:hypothetical protein